MAYSGSAADRLAEVQAAIGRCLTSQSYTTRARTQQMAQLRDLRAMEKELQQEAGMESAGGSMASLGMQVEPR